MSSPPQTWATIYLPDQLVRRWVLRGWSSALRLPLGSPFSAFARAVGFALGDSNEPCQARFESLHRCFRVVYREFFRLDSLRHPLVVTLQPRLCLGLELTPYGMIFMVVSIHVQSSRKAVEMLLEPVGMLSEGFRKVSEFVGILSKDVTDYAHDSSILNTAQTTARLDKTIYRSYRARVDNPSTKSSARARKWSANYIVAQGAYVSDSQSVYDATVFRRLDWRRTRQHQYAGCFTTDYGKEGFTRADGSAVRRSSWSRLLRLWELRRGIP